MSSEEGATINEIARNGCPVNDDSLVYIFSSLHDFEDLAALSSVSKKHWQVYVTYKDAIQRSVAWNLVGVEGVKAMVATHAKRLVADAQEKDWDARRAARGILHQVEDEVDEDDYDSEQEEEERIANSINWMMPTMPTVISELTVHLSLEDVNELRILDKQARQLERLFSRRHLDMLSETSIMLYESSQRFRRAVFNHETFSVLFGKGGSRHSLLWEEESKRHADVLDYLRDLDLAELMDMRIVAASWVLLWKWCENANQINQIPSPFSTASAAHMSHVKIEQILRAARGRESGLQLGWGPIYDDDFMEVSLKALERELDLDSGTLVKCDIGDTFGRPKAYTCDKCHQVVGHCLYPEMNWHLLPGDIPGGDLMSLIPPRYRKQHGLMDNMSRELRRSAFSFKSLWDDMIYHLPPEEQFQRRAESICIICVKSRITEMFPGWIRRYLARSH